MSQFASKNDMVDMVCPYCNNRCFPPKGAESELETIQLCENCGSRFYFNQDVIVVNHSHPDCELNGDKHTFELKSDYRIVNSDFCYICGKHKKPGVL